MKVFLSWSGDRSKAVASALCALLPSILQPIDCWMSEGGLAKGKPWFDQLAKELNGIVFGVFCVTAENNESPWMLWEAGFLSSVSAVGDRHVAPLAIGMAKGALSGPLQIYQGTDCTKDDLLRLIKEINGSLPADKRVPVQRLESTFGYVWPDLEERIVAAAALPLATKPAPAASPSDQLAEVVALLREGQREAAETKAMFRQLEARVEASSVKRFVFADPTNPAGGPGTLSVGRDGIVFGGTNYKLQPASGVLNLSDAAAGSGIVFGTSGSPD